jgi:hypothetical protein
MMKQKRNKGTRWVALLAKGMNLSVKIYLGMKVRMNLSLFLAQQGFYILYFGSPLHWVSIKIQKGLGAFIFQ